MNTLKRSLAAVLVSLPLVAFPFLASALSLADIKSVFEKFIAPITLPSAFFSQFAAVGTIPAPPTNVQPTGREAIAPADLQELRNLTRSLVAPATTPTVAPPPPSGPLQAAITTQVQNAVKEQVQLAIRRKVLMEMIAKRNPEVFLQNMMSGAVRARLSSEVQAHIERQVTLTGTTEVLHIDDFDNPDNSRFQYHLRTGNKRTELSFVGDAPLLSSGATLRVEGFQIGDTMAAEGGPASTQILYQPVPDALGAQKTLFILVTSPGKPATPTRAQMRETIFNGAFQKFYKEQSYNQTWFEGDVTEWISVPVYASHCGAVDLGTPSIREYLMRNNVDLSRYGRLVFVVNFGEESGGGCATAGKINMEYNGRTYLLSTGYVLYPNSSRRRPNMSGFESVLSHEMGHELGVDHANSWNCSGPSLDTNCVHDEYGNEYDMMGARLRSSHFNAYYKDRLGWFSTSSKFILNGVSGSYTLAPLEGTVGRRVAILTNPATPSVPPLYVEFRQPIGFDSHLPLSSAGLFLNQVIGSGMNSMTRLLNANYTTTSNPAPSLPVDQPALMPGSTFTWPGRGIAINMLGISPTLTPPSSALFSVSFTRPVCIRNGMEFTNVSFNKTVDTTVRDQFYMNFVLVNNDGPACVSSIVSATATVAPSSGISLWKYPNDPSIAIAPTDTQSFMFAFNELPANIPTGDYQVTITVTDTTNNRTFTLSRTVKVIGRPTGTLTTTNCTIPAGQTTCTFNSSWTTSNAINGIRLTFTEQGGTEFNMLNDGSPATYTNWPGHRIAGTHTVKLYDSRTNTLLDSKQVVIAAPAVTNNPPLGYLDGNCSSFWGWAYDPDAPSTSIIVRIVDERGTVYSSVANAVHTGVNTARNLTGKHGIYSPFPTNLKDGKLHTFRAYGVDTTTNTRVAFVQNPKTMTCKAPIPPLAPTTTVAP